MALIIQSK